jgi:hypothetical protein
VTPTHSPGRTPTASADVRFASSCNDDWPVVYQTSPNRFVSEVMLWNAGSAESAVRVWTDWFFFGGGKTRKTLPLITLEPGQKRRVAVSKPATSSQLLRMTGWQHGDRMCKSQVVIVY